MKKIWLIYLFCFVCVFLRFMEVHMFYSGGSLKERVAVKLIQ